MPDAVFAAVQDNREPGGNPGAFFQPEGGHCENGKTKKCEDAQVRRPAFLFVFIGTAMDRNL